MDEFLELEDEERLRIERIRKFLDLDYDLETVYAVLNILDDVDDHR